MARSASAVASVVMLAAAAVACADSSPYGGAFDDTGGGGPTHGTAAGDAGAGGGGTVSSGADADAGASTGDDGGGATLVDGGVSLGDAAMPTNCTIGAAGPIAVVPAETMAPGLACGGCHLAIGKPVYIAGTVEPTYHEPDLCLGATGVQLEIVDNSGASHTLAVDSSGNFLDQNPLALWPAPWKVAVVRGSARRDMVGTVMDGDCNSCHTVAGASSAPGRIIPPDPDGDGG